MLTNNKLKIVVSYKGKYGFWRMMNIIILGLLVSGTMFTYYFIYQNIYSTIANANAVVALRLSQDVFDLDLQAYEKAEAVIRQKTQPEEIPDNIRNIFYYRTSTPIYANTNTQP